MKSRNESCWYKHLAIRCIFESYSYEYMCWTLWEENAGLFDNWNIFTSLTIYSNSKIGSETFDFVGEERHVFESYGGALKDKTEKVG